MYQRRSLFQLQFSRIFLLSIEFFVDSFFFQCFKDAAPAVLLYFSCILQALYPTAVSDEKSALIPILFLGAYYVLPFLWQLLRFFFLLLILCNLFMMYLGIALFMFRLPGIHLDSWSYGYTRGAPKKIYLLKYCIFVLTCLNSVTFKVLSIWCNKPIEPFFPLLKTVFEPIDFDVF